MIQVMPTQPVSPSPGLQGLAAALHAAVTSLKATRAHSVFLFWVLSRVLPGVASAQMKWHHVHPNSSFPTGLRLRGGFAPPWFLCFTALVSSIPYCKHISEKQQVLEWACREAVEVWHLQTRRLEEKDRTGMTLCFSPRQGFVFHLAPHHEGFLAQGLSPSPLVPPTSFPQWMLRMLRIWKALGSCAMSKDAHWAASNSPGPGLANNINHPKPLFTGDTPGPAQSKRCGKNTDPGTSPMQREICL